MRTETVKRKGRHYVLLTEMKRGKLSISVNGEELKPVYYNEKRKVWFAPCVTEEGNFWAIVYNSKPYLSVANGDLTVEEFENHYIPKAYSPLMTIVWLLLAIVLPEMLYMVYAVSLNVSYEPNVLLIIIPVFYYFLVNSAPITTVKTRRLLCMWIFVYGLFIRSSRKNAYRVV